MEEMWGRAPLERVMSVIWNRTRLLLLNRFSSRSRALNCPSMSYSGYRRRGGGPNRGGGRGRGRGRGRGGGGPPPGLSGKEIGMHYRNKSLEKKKEREKNERAVVSISGEAQANISRILNDVRRESQPDEQTDRASYQKERSRWDPGQGPSGTAADIWWDSGGACGKGEPSGQDTFSSGSAAPLQDPLHHSHNTQGGEGGSSVMSDKLEALSQEMRRDLHQKRQTNTKYQRMLEFRQKLPSWSRQGEIVELVRENQVVVLSGETGCGKTTQVPQFILEDAVERGVGAQCQIMCTQPRRISAISVAKRVAEERGERLGQSVGFQIRLENQLPEQRGSILYCTTGILLRRMINDPLLREVSHVVLDEVHERSVQSDFLTIVIKDILPHRPDLKVILMSATLNAELFSQYFGGVPTYNIPSVVFPVAQYFLEDVLQMTRFSAPLAARRQVPVWVRHQRGKAQALEKKRTEEQERTDYINSLEARRAYPPYVLEALRNLDPEQLSIDLILELVKMICREQGPGAILVFLPGWDTITKLHDMLKADPVFRSRNYLIIPLHSLMPTAFQQSVFDRPPEGVRKIVIATNIAETSITIDDVVYVIDCGKVKETTYDVNNQLACLEAVWVSKAAARQRKGRAGRVQPGKCYHLFTKHQLERLADYQLPEMLRTPLEELILQIKILGLGEAAAFLNKAIEPPSETAVLNAISSLRQLSALDADENLTSLGHHLANLPVNPRVGKIILFAAIFSCLSPVLTIASSLGFKEPFIIPLHKQEEADEVKRKFAEETRSDHIALLRAFEGWEVACRERYAREYCWENFLSHNTLELLKNMKRQFCGLLYDTGFVHSPDPDHDEANFNSDNIKLVKAVLCAGLYPNVAKIVQTHPDRPPKLYEQETKVKFHPKSVNSDETSFDNKFVIYHTKIKSSAVFLHDSSMITPFPLLFFGGNISVDRDGDQQIIAVDRWIKFQAPHRIAMLVKEMREQLDLVLKQKVRSPRMDLYTPLSPTPSASSQLIHSIIDLIASEDYQWQAQRLAAGKHLYVRGAK